MANHTYRGLAVVFSFLLPGLGQIYNQQFAKGARFIGAYIVSWALCPIVIGWVLLVIVWIWSMVDAYGSAGRVPPPPRPARQNSHAKAVEQRSSL